MRQTLVTLCGCAVFVGASVATSTPTSLVHFTDVTHEAGIDFRYTFGDQSYGNILESSGSGATVLDYDGAAEELREQLPLLLENDGRGRFRNVGPTRGSYFSEKRSGRGATVWDFDDDGDLDIIVSHVDLRATAALLRNDGGNRNHWLGLTLVGAGGPASAIGAKVTAQAGQHRQVAINQPAASYLSYRDPRIHIGLGTEARADRLEVQWSDGVKEVYIDLVADRYVTIAQGAGIQKSTAPVP